MKFPFLRQTVAVVLALFLALLLSMVLTAPGWADQDAGASPDATSSEIISSSPELSSPPETSTPPSASPSPTASTPPSASPSPTASTPPSASPSPTGSEPPTVSFQFANTSDEIVEPGSWTLTAYLTNAPANAEITWEVDHVPGQEFTRLPTFTGTDAAGRPATGTKIKVTDTAIKVTSHGAGEFVITATYGGLPPISKKVTVSGIILSGQKLNMDEESGVCSVEMFINSSTTLTVIPFGMASEPSEKVRWESGDSSVVSVPNNGGNLYAWGLGTATVTAYKGDYSADCTVKVVEDTSVVADNYERGYTVSASEPLIFGRNKRSNGEIYNVYQELSDMALRKGADYDDPVDGRGLRYITNLKVSTEQGRLLYNYSTDSDTGNGVGYNDQFSDSPGGAVLSVSRLFFVPNQGFSGTAEITFSAVTGNRNFTGTIRVNVNAGLSNGTYQISYPARAGEPVWFQADDFIAFCRSKTGRSFNYVTFTLPRPSEGVLYYDYMGGSGNPVTTAIQFTPSGQYTIDSVCFVPSATYEGEVSISFRAVDTSGETINDAVKVNVTVPDTSGETSTVTIPGERGKPVTLQSELFNAACQNTIHDTLSFVTFKLPDPSEGTLYYNYRSDGTYDSRLTASSRCYYSGSPGLNNVTFVPASNAVNRIAIPYTGYGSEGTSFTGTLYISLDEPDRSIIHYSVGKGGSVTFSTYDFSSVGLYKTNSSVAYVVFTSLPDPELGTLYYNYQSSSSYHPTVGYGSYYLNPSNWQNGLGQVSFRAAENAVGTAIVKYKAYSIVGYASRELFDGEVVIQVGSLSPEDVNLSCKTGGSAWLPAWRLDSVCGETMSEGLSYIEITSVPTPEEGHLYFNYNGFGTGMAVQQGARFYRYGSPSIDQLTFVPRARFTGKAEITYIAYSIDGSKQVSGKIVVNVSGSTASQYFDDMGGHVWAIDSVDCLYRNRTVKGVGDNRFNPGGTVTRGDFVLMLVRAYGFTASGSSSFSDVPAGSYYADAIRIAYQLHIVNGSNGKFNPQNALTRQDAMVMIYNALEASGKTNTNGLTADLNAYIDQGEIAPYAREAMGILLQMGVIEGVGGGRLNPQGQLTRAQAAMLLHTIMTL